MRRTVTLLNNNPSLAIENVTDRKIQTASNEIFCEVNTVIKHLGLELLANNEHSVYKDIYELIHSIGRTAFGDEKFSPMNLKKLVLRRLTSQKLQIKSLLS